MQQYDRKAMKAVWVILAVTFIPLVTAIAIFTDAFSSSLLPEILFTFSGILLGTGGVTLLTLPKRLRKPVSAVILLAYGLLVASILYLLLSLGQQVPVPEWLVGIAENPPDIPLPEQLIFGALGGFPGPALSRFLHYQSPEQSSKREAQFALLWIGAGLTLALVVSSLFS
ncbi:MAG: hypothetical protein WA982_06605 [Rubrobacteraceae bacterium]